MVQVALNYRQSSCLCLCVLRAESCATVISCLLGLSLRTTVIRAVLILYGKSSIEGERLLKRLQSPAASVLLLYSTAVSGRDEGVGVELQTCAALMSVH